MATSEEKQDLVEELKGPHYYRITVNGYGAETAYMKISKEAYEFWKESLENGDSDVVNYVIGAEDDDFDFEDIDEVPEHAQFMRDEDGDNRSWYEPPNEFAHVWGVAADHAYITIDKVAGPDWGDAHLEDIIDREDLYELSNRIGEETDWEVEMNVGLDPNAEYPLVEYAKKGDFVCQFMSSEKGCFFETVLETPGLLDIKKLQFVIDEAPNGEDTLFGINYEGEELDNNGGDTNGKGYSVYMWEEQY